MTQFDCLLNSVWIVNSLPSVSPTRHVTGLARLARLSLGTGQPLSVRVLEQLTVQPESVIVELMASAAKTRIFERGGRHATSVTRARPR